MESLKELTIKEATNLKQHLTEWEKQKLNKYDFNPNSTYSCIYGQITGDCASLRAIELAKLCIGKVSVKQVDGTRISTTKPKDNFRFSPLEVYIYQYGGSGEKIIDYLKGETDTLEL
jgi:hypothetical protein